MENLKAKLSQAVNTRDELKLSEVIGTIFSDETRAAFVPELCKLIQTNWHYQHENIAQLLQQIANPASVSELYQTALMKFDYLDYDDSAALARKCTWALADIGNEASKFALEKLAHGNDATVAAFAQKRLDNWASEITRKKHH